MKAQRPPLQQLGNYKLLKKLGEGGMGTVWLAEDIVGQRYVALKVLPKKLAADKEFLTRFLREAKATGKLNHLNIVSAMNVAQDHGLHYYVMEFCEGESLEAMLKRDGYMQIDRALDVAIQVARGLDHAHKNKVIHRDIKPANVMLTVDGIAKILDLGLAKSTADNGDSFNTTDGKALGTPHYISPEQARGDDNIDGRSDIYSLGATLYHLLTGTTPYQGATPAVVMTQHLREPIPNPRDPRPEVPEGLAAVMRKMMAKEPSDRFDDCSQLIEEFERVAAGEKPLCMEQQKDGSNRMILRKGSPKGTNDKLDVAKRPEKTEPVLQTPRADSRKDTPIRKPKTPTGLVIGAVAAVVLISVGIWMALSMRDRPRTGVERAAASADEDSFPNLIKNLPINEHVPRVMAKLKELNPGFEGSEQHAVVESGKVLELTIPSQRLKDISPLKALPHLRRLVCAGTSDAPSQLNDLTPLRGMPLKELDVSYSLVTDLAPLAGMPLTDLWLKGTKVSDLSPLKDSKLGVLFCDGAPIEDLSPLPKADLRVLSARYTKISDLAPLKGMPLSAVYLQGAPVTDLAPIKWMGISTLDLRGTTIADRTPLMTMPLKELNLDFANDGDALIIRGIRGLEKINGLSPVAFYSRLWDAFNRSVIRLAPDAQAQRVADKLKEVNPDFDGKFTFKAEGGKVVEFQIATNNVEILTPIRALSFLRKLECDGVVEAGVTKGRVTDLSPLRGLPLKQLSVSRNPSLSDLTPLRGMQLEALRCNHTNVRLLAPLSLMQSLKVLILNSTMVAELTPLSNLKLTHLNLRALSITDFAPLKAMPLEELEMAPAMGPKSAPVLTQIQTLKTINGVTVEEFFSSLEAKQP